MYNVFFMGRSNGPNGPVYTDQVTQLEYTSQLLAEQAQAAVFAEQDGVAPRLQLSLADRKALYAASQE